MDKYQKERINELLLMNGKRYQKFADYLRDPNSSDHAKAERADRILSECLAYANGMREALEALGYSTHYTEDQILQVL